MSYYPTIIFPIMSQVHILWYWLHSCRANYFNCTQSNSELMKGRFQVKLRTVTNNRLNDQTSYLH